MAFWRCCAFLLQVFLFCLSFSAYNYHECDAVEIIPSKVAQTREEHSTMNSIQGDIKTRQMRRKHKKKKKKKKEKNKNKPKKDTTPAPNMSPVGPSPSSLPCPAECVKCLVEVSSEWLVYCLSSDGGCGRDDDGPYIYLGDGFKVFEGTCTIQYFSGPGKCVEMDITSEEQESCVTMWKPVVDAYLRLKGVDTTCDIS